MDGTLTKPNLDFVEMYRRAGVDRSEDILAAIAAMPPAEKAAAQAVVDEMEAEGRRTLQLMPGAVALAHWLRAHGIPTAMVTRNTRCTVDHLHEALWTPAGLPAFAPAHSRDDDGSGGPPLPPKPDPAALASIAAAWGVPLGPEILMVGDSPANDVGFGKAAGVSTALLDTGRRVAEGGSDGGVCWQGGSNFGPGWPEARRASCSRVRARAGSAAQADLVVDSLARLPHRIWQRFEIGGDAAAPLTKYEPPLPSGAAALAAAAGDAGALASLPLDAVVAADGSGNTPLIWAANAGHEAAARAIPLPRAPTGP